MMKKLWILLLFLAIVSQPLNTYAASNVDLSRVNSAQAQNRWFSPSKFESRRCGGASTSLY